jgi:group I intron endonuclease
MKFIFFDKANFGGVYKLTNIQNGRIYIGSTSRFKDRARAHSNDLIANRHLNKFMQNDFNKCGTDAFLFEVIEVVEGNKEQRLAKEQVYIDRFYDNQKNCYNLAKEAKDTRGGTRNKKQIDPLTDGRCKPFSEERLEKHSKKLKETWQDPELKDLGKQNAMKRWNKHSANIKVRNIQTGEEVLITGSIRQWCKDVGVSYKAFHQLVKGKLNKSGGWALAIETS